MGLFDSLTRQADVERWRQFVATLPRPRPKRTDWLDGYLPKAQAASVMKVDGDELVRMAAQGLLEHRLIDGELYVRPAVVSKMAVRDRPVENESQPLSLAAFAGRDPDDVLDPRQALLAWWKRQESS